MHTSSQQHGVLTLSGFGIRVFVQQGYLVVADGVAVDRRKLRFPRVGHALRRLVCISDDGFVTLGALKWLGDLGISLVFLDRIGKPLFVTGPTASSEVRLRRAQALAMGNGVGLEICRTLISAKLQAQERLVRERMQDAETAKVIAGFHERLAAATEFRGIRVLEAHAAIAYFNAWRNVPVRWPRKDLRRTPEHWRIVGARHSPLSGGPRLAVTPVHAILNYCFALLESEARLALSSLGLDSGVGVGLHTDTANRDSLALDVLEPVRPQVEGWVLDWILREPLRRSDFFETSTGNCRLASRLCAELNATAPTWAKLVAPWAEYVVGALCDRSSRTGSGPTPPTRLTQRHRREAKSRPAFRRVDPPKVEHVCSGCGKRIHRDSRFCSDCSVIVTGENFTIGRRRAQNPESLAKRSATQAIHRAAMRIWKPSDLPSWLTRDVYVKRVLPALGTIQISRIQSDLRVSQPYAALIQCGKRIPHPRHWQVLARAVGL